jgi:hypothetical protein
VNEGGRRSKWLWIAPLDSSSSSAASASDLGRNPRNGGHGRVDGAPWGLHSARRLRGAGADGVSAGPAAHDRAAAAGEPLPRVQHVAALPGGEDGAQHPAALPALVAHGELHGVRLGVHQGGPPRRLRPALQAFQPSPPLPALELQAGGQSGPRLHGLLLHPHQRQARSPLRGAHHRLQPHRLRRPHLRLLPPLARHRLGQGECGDAHHRHVPASAPSKDFLSLTLPFLAFQSGFSADVVFFSFFFLPVLQIIPVDRVDPASRHHAAGHIRRRAIDNKWPHVMLFPEGTTTNGKAIISFKTGAFSPGLPVQPMIIRYPHKYVNPCWCDQGGPVVVLLQLMTQFVNYMEVCNMGLLCSTLFLGICNWCLHMRNPEDVDHSL